VAVSVFKGFKVKLQALSLIATVRKTKNICQ